MPEPAAAAVVFDMDGVLVDSEGLWYRAYGEVLAQFGVSVTREVYAREWVSRGRGAEYACATFPQITITPEELKRRRTPIVQRLVVEEAELMPGVVPALERLAVRFPLALATNSSAAIVEPLFEKHGLARWFDGRLVTKECYPRPKPAPDAFLAAAAALGVPPGRCVVIEDAEKGVLAAHAAGTRCIAVPNWWTEDNDFSTADRVVPSLDEVTPELVETVLSEPPLVVRDATETDRTAIWATHLASIRGVCSRAYAPEDIEAWADGRAPEKVALDRDRHVVAEDADGVAGFGAVSLTDRYVDAVYLVPPKVGRGIGARILSRLERIARDAGVEEMTLDASLNAVPFYATHGWRRAGDSRHRFRNGREIACVRMTKRLVR